VSIYGIGEQCKRSNFIVNIIALFVLKIKLTYCVNTYGTLPAKITLWSGGETNETNIITK